MITFEEAHANFRYDSRTGLLWWKTRRSRRSLHKPAGHITKQGYWSVELDGKGYQVHRLIWFMKKGIWPKYQLDHRDNERANNKWKNLREATQKQNSANAKVYKNTKSGLKGVFKAGPQKFYAYIRVNNQLSHLGCFSTAKEAQASYKKAAKKHFGEFARAA